MERWPWDVRRRRLTTAETCVRPSSLKGRKVVVEPLGQLNVPCNGRVCERVDGLDETGRHQAPPGTTMKLQTCRQGTAVELVKIDSASRFANEREAPGQDVGDADPAKRA